MAGLTRREALAGSTLLAALPATAGAGAPAPGVATRKTLAFVRRRSDLDPAAFITQWRSAWAEAAVGHPAVLGLVLHEITSTARRPDIPAGEDVSFDGIAEIWSAGDEPAPTAGEELISASLVLAVRETVVIPARRGDVCLIALLRRKLEVSHAAFVRHWIDVHGAMARSVPRVRGLVLDEVVAVQADPAGLFADVGEIDGVAQSYREDPSRPLDSPEAAAWYADGAASIGHARTYRTFEHVVKFYG